MAEPLTHPSIKDGWFMEKSSMWPGQGVFAPPLSAHFAYLALTIPHSYDP